MVEKNLVINSRTITYKGIFKIREIFKTVNDALEKLGYQKSEKKTEETVTPSGKKTFVEIRPYKIKTNYVTLMIKIKIMINNVVEVSRPVDGVNTNFQQGEVRVIFDAWSLTDWEARWGMKPTIFFLKAWIFKWFYRLPSEEVYIGELSSDTGYIHDQIKSLLNLYKYQTQS